MSNVANRTVVELLEEWLASAREGKIVSIGVCGVTSFNSTVFATAKMGAAPSMLVASSAMLHNQTIRFVLDRCAQDVPDMKDAEALADELRTGDADQATN